MLAASRDSPACTEDNPRGLGGSRSCQPECDAASSGGRPRTPPASLFDLRLLGLDLPSPMPALSHGVPSPGQEGPPGSRDRPPPPNPGSSRSATWSSLPVPPPLASPVGGSHPRVCTVWVRPWGCRSQCRRQRDPRQRLPGRSCLPPRSSGRIPETFPAGVMPGSPERTPIRRGPCFALQGPGRLGRSWPAAYGALEPQRPGPRGPLGPGRARGSGPCWQSHRNSATSTESLQALLRPGARTLARPADGGRGCSPALPAAPRNGGHLWLKGAPAGAQKLLSAVGLSEAGAGAAGSLARDTLGGEAARTPPPRGSLGAGTAQTPPPGLSDGLPGLPRAPTPPAPWTPPQGPAASWAFPGPCPPKGSGAPVHVRVHPSHQRGQHAGPNGLDHGGAPGAREPAPPGPHPVASHRAHQQAADAGSPPSG